MLLLLRAHLERAQKARKKHTPSTARKDVRSRLISRVKQLNTTDGASDDGVKRALIAGILTEQFGDATVNDPKFQLIVNEVLGLLATDEEAGELVNKAVTQLMRTKD